MKYALVTGASSGIGLEYARQLAAAGHNILVVSNRREENDAVAAELRSAYGIDAVPVYADLAESGSAERLYGVCRDMGAEVDILVSNAGLLHFARLSSTAPSAVDRIVALHCTTPVKLCMLFSADMCRRGEGHILIMSSATAWMPYPTMSLYGSTKALLKSFGESLWYELRGSGVSVTTVLPGAVDTPLYELDERTRRILRGLGVMMSARKLAETGLRAMFRRRRRCIPGAFTKIAVFICRLLPACALLPVLRIPAVRRLLESR